MSLLTLLALALVLVPLTGRVGHPRALAVAGATPAGAALVVGSLAVPTFYAVALGTVTVVVVTHLISSRLHRRQERPAGPLGHTEVLLILFLVWSTLVTLVAPLLLDGQEIVSPGADRLAAGTLTSSNIAQVVYLALGVCVVVLLVRSPWTRVEVVGTAIGLCLLLSFWRYLAGVTGLPFPDGVFDNSSGFVYIETEAGGAERFRGILSEPAGLAISCVVGVAYMLPRAAASTGWRRAGCLAVVAIAVWMGVVSTSATFVVAGLAWSALAGLVAVAAFLANRAALRPSTLVGAGVAAVGLLVAWGFLASFVTSLVGSKIGSGSYAERSSADADSLRVFLDTYGLGVGLGSARASSFAPTLVSATGLVGAVLLVAAIVVALVGVRGNAECRPVVWAFVGLMVVKLTSSPDLHDPSGVMWLSLGVLAAAARRRTVRGERTSRSADPTHAGA